MPLPAAWVESIFARLAVRYGVAFMRQYADLDPEAVKADWANILDGFERHPAAIAYGLDNLGPTPPNAHQFRDACRRMPEPAQARLPAPKEDPELGRRVLRDWKARDTAAALVPPAVATVRRLRAIEASGRRLTLAQRDMLRSCERLASSREEVAP